MRNLVSKRNLQLARLLVWEHLLIRSWIQRSGLVLRQRLTKGDCSLACARLVFFGYFFKLCWQGVCSLSRTLPCSRWIRVNLIGVGGKALEVVAIGQLEDLLCIALSQTMHPQHSVHCSQSRGLSFEQVAMIDSSLLN